MMKKLLFTFFSITALLIYTSFSISAQDAGKTAFKQTCGACHTIGQGKLVGPDLSKVGDRRTDDWLVKFIKSPKAMVDGKDKTADSLFQVYKVMMPDHPNLNDAQIHEILAYIKVQSSTPLVADNTSQAEVKVAKKPSYAISDINIVLVIAMLFMFCIILALARINKKLVNQLKDYYSSDRSLFHK